MAYQQKNNMKTSEEFMVGKHGIGYIYEDKWFSMLQEQPLGDPVQLGSYQTLPRSMRDSEIESELKPGICTTADVLAFLDNAPEECKDGYANLFYFPAFVVVVVWRSSGRGWRVDAWERVGNSWHGSPRVFSPATGSSGTASSSETLTLGSLDSRLKKLEKLFNL